jgi:hypothetical protein
MLNGVMQNVTNKPFMLSVLMMSVILLNVVVPTRAQCFKTFCVRILHMFAISYSVYHWQAFLG